MKRFTAALQALLIIFVALTLALTITQNQRRISQGQEILKNQVAILENQVREIDKIQQVLDIALRVTGPEAQKKQAAALQAFFAEMRHTISSEFNKLRFTISTDVEGTRTIIITRTICRLPNGKPCP